MVKNYIKDLVHMLISSVKTTHQQILSLKESKIEESRFDRNPYEIFRDWLLDVFQFGVVISFCIFVFIFSKATISRIILYPFAFGMLKWSIIRFVNEIRGK
jgi:hypothetical protein